MAAAPRSIATTLTADEQVLLLRYVVARRGDVEPLARFRNESDAHDYAMRVGVKDGSSPIVVDEGEPYRPGKSETNRRYYSRRAPVPGRRADDFEREATRRA